MSKYLRNNIKAARNCRVLWQACWFSSPVLSALALLRVLEAARGTTEATTTTEAPATETTAAVVATDDDSDAEVVGSYMGVDGIMRNSSFLNRWRHL